MFKEINKIWLEQAGICFEIRAVDHDRRIGNGIDMWFSPDTGIWNGYYDGEIIQMNDAPVLAPAPQPAQSPAARTAAHELGHALGLPHRQNSDDNLMRSKTYGYQLNDREIAEARAKAEEMALEPANSRLCAEPKIRVDRR